MKPSQFFFNEAHFLHLLWKCISMWFWSPLDPEKKRLKDTSVLTWIHKVTYPVQYFIYNASDPQLSETLVT